MYLKLVDKLSPKKVAIALLPQLRPEQVEWDYENVHEWAYVDLPELTFSLDVTREHGMCDLDDEVLDGLSPEEIEDLPTAGATYIFGWNRRSDSYVPDLPDSLIQKISDSIKSEILVYPGRINIDSADTAPTGRIKPIR